MVATNLIGKKLTTPEQMLLQQIDERNKTWASEDSVWKTETETYNKQYNDYLGTQPSHGSDYITKLNEQLAVGTWIPTADPVVIERQMEAARRVANKYADKRQYDFNQGLIKMQNTRTERVQWYNSQLSGRNNQLERYLDLRAKDAEASLARKQGLAAEQQRRSSASFLAEEEQVKGKTSFLEGM